MAELSGNPTPSPNLSRRPRARPRPAPPPSASPCLGHALRPSPQRRQGFPWASHALSHAHGPPRTALSANPLCPGLKPRPSSYQRLSWAAPLYRLFPCPSRTRPLDPPTLCRARAHPEQLRLRAAARSSSGVWDVLQDLNQYRKRGGTCCPGQPWWDELSGETTAEWGLGGSRTGVTGRGGRRGSCLGKRWGASP